MAATRTITVPVALLANLEATDAEIGDHGQHIDIGPLADGTYLRVVTDDLLAAVDQLRRLANEIEEGALDARLTLRRPCPGDCNLLIDPDDEYCGSTDCARRIGADQRVEAWT